MTSLVPCETGRLQRTPGLVLGPFYPLHCPGMGDVWTPHDMCADVNRSIEIRGRILNLAGAPVADALVEVWHADASGHYRHPSAMTRASEDPGFKGCGALRTDAAGRYAFATLKPGAYAEGVRWRAPHVHFQVTGFRDRLVTQMFFPGETLNETDFWYGSIGEISRLVAKALADTSGRLLFGWDIVLSTG